MGTCIMSVGVCARLFSCSCEMIGEQDRPARGSLQNAHTLGAGRTYLLFVVVSSDIEEPLIELLGKFPGRGTPRLCRHGQPGEGLNHLLICSSVIFLEDSTEAATTRKAFFMSPE